MVLEFLGGSFDSWVVGFFIVFASFIALFILDRQHVMRVRKLINDGVLHTKRGTFTFTPKEKTTNEQ